MTNPFQITPKDEDVKGTRRLIHLDQDPLLQGMLTFLKLSKHPLSYELGYLSRTYDNVNDDDDDDNNGKMQMQMEDDNDTTTIEETVERLLGNLQEEKDDQLLPSSSSSAFVSKMDIAALLLPWATKQLLQLCSPKHSPKAKQKQLSTSRTRTTTPSTTTTTTNTTTTIALLWKTVAQSLNTLLGISTQTHHHHQPPPKQSPHNHHHHKKKKNHHLAQHNNSKSPPPPPPQFAKDVVVSNLSQSVLNKVVPFAAHTALTSPHEHTRLAASQTYQVLVERLYRPTMDLVCHSLLCTIAHELHNLQQSQHPQSLSSSPLPHSVVLKEHACIVLSTVKLLQTLQRQHAAPPKKMFLLLSSSQALTALTHMYFISTTTTTEEDNNNNHNHNKILTTTRVSSSSIMVDTPSSTILHIQNTIQTILWNSFFHSIDHMNGFRSMNMNVPLVGGGIGSEEGKERMETMTSPVVDRDTANRKRPMTKSTKPIMSCYQENLGKTLVHMLGITSTQNDTKTDHNTNGDDGDGDGDDSLHPTSLVNIVAVARLAPLLLEEFITQTEEWEKKHQSSLSVFNNRGTGSVETAHFQYRFWSRMLAYPMVLKLRQCTTTTTTTTDTPATTPVTPPLTDAPTWLLQSLYECLVILLKKDVYLPSYEDPQDHHFQFLEWVGSSVLCHLESLTPPSEVEDDKKEEEEEKEDTTITTTSYTTTHQIIQQQQHQRNQGYQVLVTLTNLNHLVLHERLPQLLGIVASQNMIFNNETTTTTTTKGGPTSVLVATIIDTYQKLRQLDHLFHALLLTISNFATNKNDHNDRMEEDDDNDSDNDNDNDNRVGRILQQVHMFNHIILESQVSQAFSIAIQSCPQEQMKQIVNAMNDWIKDQTTTTTTPNDNDNNTTKCSAGVGHLMEAAVTLFTLFIRNVRVDKHSASEVAQICHESLQSSVVLLLSGTPQDRDDDVHKKKEEEGRRQINACDPLLRQGLLLGGWLIDLQTRCSFWTGNLETAHITANKGNDDDDIVDMEIDAIDATQVISDILNTAVDVAVQEKDLSSLNPLLNELQLLACHRIQQLHSQIHEQDRLEQSTGKTSAFATKSSVLVEEARQLVTFAVLAATTDNVTHESESLDDSTSNDHRTCFSRWKPLAQMVGVWTSYTHKEQMTSFLDWFFQTLAASDDGENPTMSKLEKEDVAIVNSLLNDASFFEIDEIWSELYSTGLSNAVEMVQKALSKGSCVLKGVNLAISSRDSRYSPLTADQRAKIMESSPPKPSKTKISRPMLQQQLEQTCNILMTLDGILESAPEAIGVSDCRVDSDILIRFEILMNNVLCKYVQTGNKNDTSSASATSLILRLICIIRTHLSRVFRNASRDTVCSLFPNGGSVSSFVTGLYQRTVSALHCNRTIEKYHEDQLLSSTEHLISSVYSMLASICNKDHLPLEAFLQHTGEVVNKPFSEGDHDNIEFIKVSIIFARSLVRQTSALKQPEEDAMDVVEDDDGSFGVLCQRQVREVVTDSLFHSSNMQFVIKCIQNDVWNPKTSDCCNSLSLLIGDLFNTFTAEEIESSLSKNNESFTLFVDAIDNAFDDMFQILLPPEQGQENSPTVMDLAQEEQKRAATYFLACTLASTSTKSRMLSATRTTSFVSKLLQVIQYHFISSGGNQPNELLDAAFSSTVQQIGSEDLQAILTKLLKFPDDAWSVSSSSIRSQHIACSVHLFDLILLNVTAESSPDKRKELEIVSSDFMFLALELFYPRPIGLVFEVSDSTSDSSSAHSQLNTRRKQWEQHIEIGSQLILSLMDEKELLRITERDLALILASIDTATSPGATSTTSPFVEPSVYAACNSLVAALIQRFPKQLYTCCPSLIASVDNLFRHALWGSLQDTAPSSIGNNDNKAKTLSTSKNNNDIGDNSMTTTVTVVNNRCQRIVRLTELLVPHRDVLKKHVLGMIHEFVTALQDPNFHPYRKQSLMPAIYNLLDMLTVHETQTLNAMMTSSSNTGKAMFKSVYENYQKLHKYKGQY